MRIVLGRGHEVPYISWIQYSILIVLFLTGCVTTTAKSVKPTPDLVTRQFEAAAFGNGFGNGSRVLKRWTSLLLVDARGGNTNTLLPHEDDLENTPSSIKQLTGIACGTAKNDSRPSVGRNFARRRHFSNIVKKLPNRGRSSAAMARTSACFAMTFGDAAKGIISTVVVGIATDISKVRRRYCIPEEFMQVMGLPGDACHYQPSLICEGENRIFEMLPADKLKLTSCRHAEFRVIILYHTRFNCD